MNRRDFVRICSANAGFSLISDAIAAAPSVVRAYGRARLYDAAGAPLRSASLAIQRNYVFFYPFQATPCFLLNLGKPVPLVRPRLGIGRGRGTHGAPAGGSGLESGAGRRQGAGTDRKFNRVSPSIAP